MEKNVFEVEYFTFSGIVFPLPLGYLSPNLSDAYFPMIRHR